jgi:hypothetical protein
MKIKLLAISAVIFFLLGWNTKDGVLFFFFAADHWPFPFQT